MYLLSSCGFFYAYAVFILLVRLQMWDLNCLKVLLHLFLLYIFPGFLYHIINSICMVVNVDLPTTHKHSFGNKTVPDKLLGGGLQEVIKRICDTKVLQVQHMKFFLKIKKIYTIQPGKEYFLFFIFQLLYLQTSI